MKSYFFNAEPSEDTAAHPTGYDREYDADDHASFFTPFFSEAGVFAGTDADACKVVVDSGNTLKVNAGCVYVRGRMCQFDGTETVTARDGDRIVARMNKTADVRAFQLLAVQALTQTEDIYDLQLATVAVEAITGGYQAVVTDTRTFLSYMGQPAYYPPSADNLPYVLWLYTLGFPMTADQRSMVEANPSLMGIFNGSLGASRAVAVTFAEADWVSEEGVAMKQLSIPLATHQRQTSHFTHIIRHKLPDGSLSTNTWAVHCTDVVYSSTTGSIMLRSEDAYNGEIVFMGG